MNFKGRTILVTGAGRGIGRELAVAFARAGASVVVADIAEGESPTTLEEIKKLAGDGMFIQMDVSSSAKVLEGVKEIIDVYGKIDVLVNNAGITRDSLLLRLKDEDWDKVIDVNLKGVFNMTKAVLPIMIRGKYGRIINISSVIGLMGNPGQTNYAASKAGVIGFTKALAREVASRSITVNAVAPGYIDTEMTRVLPDSIKEKLLQLIPAGRLGTTADVASGVLFLASEEASYITGQVLNINGGMYM
ncbi:MAG: 3-oxoacyl-[acyl-carrier-protein] reductase [Acidobacteriota bacterium]